MADAGPKPAPEGATGLLVLADGTAIWGRGFGAEGEAVGEVCFNTAMTGYQEIMTDPSDVREGEGDDLARIGGIGHDLLVAGHRGVEADFADRLAFRPESPAPDDCAVGEDQYARRILRRRRVHGVGHCGGHSFGGLTMSLRLVR